MKTACVKAILYSMTVQKSTPNKRVKFVPLRCTGLATLRFASRLPKRYTLGGYLKFVLLFFSALVAGCSQGSCNKWEYASFSMTSYTIIENDEVKGVDTSALWVSVEGTAFFKNDKLMSKDSNKEISEFFKASSSHPVAILSALGRDSWEVYDYENYRSDPNSQHKEWELKRCY